MGVCHTCLDANKNAFYLVISEATPSGGNFRGGKKKTQSWHAFYPRFDLGHLQLGYTGKYHFNSVL